MTLPRIRFAKPQPGGEAYIPLPAGRRGSSPVLWGRGDRRGEERS